MHMADALLSPAVAGGMYACSLVAAGYALRKVQQERNDKILPVMGVMGAFVFAAQMLNFTIPGTGSSGHLCGGMLLAAVVGPYAAFLTMIGVLLIQCLLFADGGLMALGANIWNMAFYGCFVGGLIWRARRLIQRKDRGDPSRYLTDLTIHAIRAAMGAPRWSPPAPGPAPALAPALASGPARTETRPAE